MPTYKTISIIDWTGNVLYTGPFNSLKVGVVLDSNRCKCIQGCSACDDTGYIGDFEVSWNDDTVTSNVYEYINY